MYKKQGFTLIELLVVVLIIGILSAVALPQYNRAVLKARYTEMQTIAAAYKTAAEVYYLANGEYPSYWDDMDLEPPAGCTASQEIAGGLYCPSKNIAFDLYDNQNKNIVSFYYPNGIIKVAFVQWLDNSTKPSQRECWAADGDLGSQAFCRGLNGTAGGTVSHYRCSSGGGCTRYVLP